MTTNFKTSVLRESVVSLDASILHIWYFYFPRLATDSVFIKPGTRPRQQYGRSISNVKICVPTWNETSCFYKRLLMSLEGNFLSPTSSLFPPVETWRSHSSPVSALCHLISVMCPASLQNASRTIQSPGWLLQPLHLRGFQPRGSQQILTGRTIE